MGKVKESQWFFVFFLKLSNRHGLNGGGGGGGEVSAEEHWLYCEPLLNEQVHWRKLVSTTCIHNLILLVCDDR